MESAYPVVDTIRTRRSVRTYQDRPLSSELIDAIQAYIRETSNPFGAEVKICMTHRLMDGSGEKLGTYGVIKGATTFLGLSAAPGDKALLGAGFQFEDVILFLTSLGLGTVWLAATFSRGKFQSAMDIPEGFLFPAISPVGYPLGKRLLERIMRRALGSDNRKPWSELFFDENFGRALTPARAGIYAEAFEMVRLAPSATNAQPWRLLKRGDTIHFFETHKDNAREDDIKIKQVDMGIAAFHLFKTLLSMDIKGTLADIRPTDIETPHNYHYVASWIRQDEQ